MKKIYELGLIVLSASLLILSYPRFCFWFLAWVGFVPLLFVLDGKTPIQAFKKAYLCGVIFFVGTLYWFVHVTGFGAALLVFYLAIYFGFFAFGYAFFSKRSLNWQLVLLPSLWVCLEFIRSKLISGFGWVSLGHSQYKILPVIQIADFSGVFGVSFVVFMVNVLIKNLFCSFSVKGKKISGSVIGVTVILFLVVFYGFLRLNANQETSNIKVAVVQANIPQTMKWQPDQWPAITEKFLDLTQQAAESNPDIIIWPETSFPGQLWASPELLDDLKEFIKELKIPLLFGAITKEGDKYYNSAILVSEKGEEIYRYNKLHLVPFGEYIPGRKYFPAISEFVPIEDFTPGSEAKVFKFKDSSFAVLICFEDTVSYVARKLVNSGANLLINITNDAWFEDSKAPFLHMQAAVFSAVENKRSLVRSANTGVSCFINKTGRILTSLKDKNNKETFVAGYAYGDVSLNEEKTIYTKFGDVFTYLCFGCILFGAFVGVRDLAYNP